MKAFSKKRKIVEETLLLIKQLQGDREEKEAAACVMRLHRHVRLSNEFAGLVENLFYQTDNFWVRQDVHKTLKNIWLKCRDFSKAIKHLYRPWRRDTHNKYTPTQNMHKHTHRHLKANADTQTLVHCSLKLSLCVDFSGLLNLVWGQRRCPLDSFMQCSRFSGGRRDVSNSSHGHSTIR